MMSDDTTTRRGQHAERIAATFLQGHKLAIVAQNYHCRGGEIDLICRDGKVLVFVEVRLRTHRAFGGAAASITPTKQRRIILAAKHYLSTHNCLTDDCRIDCILIDGDGKIDWLKNAIAAD